jgi:hypothetical protein
MRHASIVPQKKSPIYQQDKQTRRFACIKARENVKQDLHIAPFCRG